MSATSRHTSSWRDISARSAPFNLPDSSPTKPIFTPSASSSAQSSKDADFSRSPISADSSQRYGQSLSRLTSPSSAEAAVSTSPSNNMPLQFGESKEGWSSVGQAMQSANGIVAPGPQQGMRKNASGQFSNEPFLGYSNIWGGQAASRPHQQLSLDQMNAQFESASLGSSHDEAPSAYPSSGLRGTATEGPGVPFGAMSSAPLSAGPTGSQALMQYHQQQHFHAQHQQQHQQHQPLAQHQQQQPLQQQPNNQQHIHHQPSHHSTMSSSTFSVEGGRNSEEITTVFIVGFPDDMSEREFANMFLFAKGFEASTLKVPMGGTNGGGSGRSGDNGNMGPGGPYNAVNVAGPGGMLEPGSWEEPAALSRGGHNNDPYASMAGTAPMAGPGSSATDRGASVGPGKIKQIIGFAKFRSRADALEARDNLNGRKIDLERGCVLKTEMAKKNLHTKQRPVLGNNTSGSIDGGNANALPINAPPFPSHGLSGPPSHSSAGHGGHFASHVGLGSRVPPPPGISGPNMGPRLDQTAYPPYSTAAQQNQNAFSKEASHAGFDPFTGAHGNAQQTHPGPNAHAEAGGFLGQHRNVVGQAAEPGLREGHSASTLQNLQGATDKWGPIDFYDGATGTNQQSQRPPMTVKSTSSRGPDWSTLSSPPAFYRDAAANNQTGSSKSSGLERVPREGSGSNDSQFQSFRADEDFGQGESMTGVKPPEQAEKMTSPTSATEKTKTAFGVGDGNGASSCDAQPSLTQSATRFSHQGATSPSVQSASRLGPLRIDSPTFMQTKQHRAFSPSSALRSPHPAEMALMSPSLQAPAFFRATSPGSPPISSPTSRSFSLDANPPGNTLFVGNLPASITSPPASTQLEEALLRVFSQKKGFRQISFRVKSTGPMCFVEFDDVGCAGRALGAVNGETLDGMVKGGLRLSFSKHPLFKGTSSSASSSVGQSRSNAATPQPSTPGIQTGDMGMIFGGSAVTSPREELSKVLATKSPPRQ